jgi:hypothetical protein
MNEKEQLEWCERNHATVWFAKSYVSVKVSDFNAIKGVSLQEAIARIEKFRQHRKQIREALESLDRDKHFPTRDSGYSIDR